MKRRICLPVGSVSFAHSKAIAFPALSNPCSVTTCLVSRDSEHGEMPVLLSEPQSLALASQLHSLRLLPVIYYWPAVRQPPPRLLPGTYIWLHLGTVTCFTCAPGTSCVFALLCFPACVPRLQPAPSCRIIWKTQQSPSAGLHRSQPGLILFESLSNSSGFHKVFIAGFGI